MICNKYMVDQDRHKIAILDPWQRLSASRTAVPSQFWVDNLLLTF